MYMLMKLKHPAARLPPCGQMACENTVSTATPTSSSAEKKKGRVAILYW
jgi:hypothetical protein